MEEAETALLIDESNLTKESLATGKIYGKFLRIRTEESIRLNLLKNELNSLYHEKREYYSGKAEPEVYKAKPFNKRLLKSEIDSYIETDEEIKLITSKIDIQNEKMSYLNDLLKMISGRQFQIKSAIDYQKLLNGGY